MKVEYFSPFAEAATTVTEKHMGAKAVRGELSAKQVLVTVHPVNILCGVNGDLEGLVMYSMTKETSIKFAETILGTQPRLFDQAVASAIAELGSSITEHSSSIFSSKGINCNITPPTLIRGSNIRISTFNIPTIVIPFIFDGVGTIEVNVSLRDTKAVVAA